MALFDLFKKSNKPYKDDATNFVYELLFCDNIDLYKKNNQQSGVYPWNILFSKTPNLADVEKVAEDVNMETRVRILAYNQLRAAGQKIDKKDLQAVIVEVGLENGLDVVASFRDGTARYINHTGKMIIWETADHQSNLITVQLFQESAKVIQQIGPWNQPRRPHPTKDMVRITFLVSDGLYFGEGPVNDLFKDQLAAPALMAATRLMQYLTEKVIATNKK